jgi:hypothetical protein
MADDVLPDVHIDFFGDHCGEIESGENGPELAFIEFRCIHGRLIYIGLDREGAQKLIAALNAGVEAMTAIARAKGGE